MANNRMMIRCRSCGASIVIAKHFLTPWRTVPELDDRLTKFFNEHYCCKNNHSVYPNSFELISEFGEGFPSEEDPILTHYYDIYDEDYNTEVAIQKEERKYDELHSSILKTMYMGEKKGE